MSLLLSMCKVFSYCLKIIQCCRVPGSCAHWFSVMWPSWMNMDHIAKQVLTNYHPNSIVDPGCLSRFRIFSIPDPGSRGRKKRRILDLDTQHRIEERTFNPKIVTKLLEWCLCRISVTRSGFFTSGIPDPGVKKHRIPDTDPQHCILQCPFEIFLSRLMFLNHFVTRVPYLVLSYGKGGGERTIIL